MQRHKLVTERGVRYCKLCRKIKWKKQTGIDTYYEFPKECEGEKDFLPYWRGDDE